MGDQATKWRQTNMGRALSAMTSVLLLSCGGGKSHSEGSKLNNIYGDDDRIVMNEQTFPFSTIGRLDSGCSAFLIGARLVATAGHCVVDESTGQLRDNLGYFGMDYDEGKPGVRARIKRAWIGSFQPTENRDKDWAILEIADPLGATRGALPLKSESFQAQDLPYQIQLAGYHTDFHKGDKVAVEQDCFVKDSGEDGRLLFDCDTGAGVSGAPLFKGSMKDAVAVAMAVSEYRNGARASVRRDQYSEDYANVAIPVQAFAGVASRLLATVDKQLPAPNHLDNAFALEIPAVERHTIQLHASASFRGGTFTDSEGEISCSTRGADCDGTYDNGSVVTLFAPATLLVQRSRIRFVRWHCNVADDFPGQTNYCRTTERECQIRVTENLTCGAWYE